ncbi:unnamed protein product, partial [Effrenium voratum]
YTVAPQSVLAPVGMARKPMTQCSGEVGMLFSLLAAQHVHGDELPLFSSCMS